MEECFIPFLFKKLEIMPEHNGFVHSIEERKKCKICNEMERKMEERQERWISQFLKKNPDIL